MSKTTETKKKKRIKFSKRDDDNMVFHKDQASIAIRSTRSSSSSKKLLPNWETYKPTLNIYSLKTMLHNKFEYYVRINKVIEEPDSRSKLFTWKCTLLQPTDGEVQTISVSFPPPNKIKTKADQNALAFWKNLEIRRNAIEKKGACMTEANEAILHLNHEFQLLTAPLSKSSLKDNEDITEEEKEEEETKQINKYKNNNKDNYKHKQ